MADGDPFGEEWYEVNITLTLWIHCCKPDAKRKNGTADFATKFSARLLLNKSGFEIVLMIKLDGLTNGKEVLRSSIF